MHYKEYSHTIEILLYKIYFSNMNIVNRPKDDFAMFPWEGAGFTSFTSLEVDKAIMRSSLTYLKGHFKGNISVARIFVGTEHEFTIRIRRIGQPIKR
jgi:hypothetical protein